MSLRKPFEVDKAAGSVHVKKNGDFSRFTAEMGKFTEPSVVTGSTESTAAPASLL